MSVFDRAFDDPVRVLDEDGEVVGDVPPLSEEALVEVYRYMRIARHFDGRAVSLQRQGRMGTYPPMSGQEAAQVASAFALADGDWIAPSYREHAASLVCGVPLRRTLLYWMGHGAGGRTPDDANVLPIAVPIASQVSHAVGMAWASSLRGDDDVVVSYFGDGATSEGDFHEGANFAGVFDLPAVLFCNNDRWATSVPRDRQTASETRAGKAAAYGIDGVQVDGMDPLAVYAVTKAAVTKARNPDADRPRPTLIEAVQYRFDPHTTADDPTVYRDATEVERWREKDPIPRLEAYLRSEGVLDDDRVAAIGADAERRVADTIDAAESTARPEPDELFEHAYAEMTPELAAQRARLRKRRETHGDAAFLRER